MSRKTLSLDGAWTFCPDHDARLTLDSLPPAARAIHVPAPWQTQGADLRDYSGVGWYWRAIELTADDLRGRAAVLRFGAVDDIADVWVNEAHVGRHEGGYLPFEFDVSAHLQSGHNTIHVRIDDDLARFAEIPHGKQSWYGPISGIWQSVALELRAPTHITALRLSPHGEQITVAVDMNRPAPNARLSARVVDPHGALVGEFSGLADQPLVCSVPMPLLWDTDAPNLYTVTAALNDGTSADILTDTCGFRTIEARDGKLWLNGQPFYMRSALDQDYYPDGVYTAPSYEFIEAQFRQAKAMGLNSLRIHIKIGDPRYYQAADRVGLLIWTELPNWQLLTDAAKARSKAVFEAMHARDFNRPSIAIRSIINEAWGIEVHNPDHQRWLLDMYDWLKALDPTRLVVDNSACNGNYHVVSDIDDMHTYYAIPDHYAQFNEWTRAFAGRPKWTYAPALNSAEDRARFTADHWHADWITPSPLVRRRGDEPLIVSEFGNWGLPDIDGLRAHYGGDPWWFDTGWQHGSGEVFPHGVDERFAHYHLNRAFASLSDLTHASQRMQLLAFKYELEEMRRHASIQGYVITEFTDLHWECNGLLDMLRRPKVITTGLAPVNADDVILPSFERVAYWEGETARIDLHVSQYSRRALADCDVRWRVAQMPSLHGRIGGIAPRQADVVGAGHIEFALPRVAESARWTLEIELFHGDERIASNWVDLYIFPRASAAAKTTVRIFAPQHADALRALGYAVVDRIADAELVVTGVLDEGLRDYLNDGGRVVWLAETDDAQQSRWGGYYPVNVGPRRGTPWSGDWASNFNWLNQDKLFKDIPTDGLVDFAFKDLTPEHVIHGVHPTHFANDVHAGLFLGWIQKPVALVAERVVGRGRLLISTFRIGAHLATHPVAAVMIRDLIARSAG
jgi:hypothetical protein